MARPLPAAFAPRDRSAFLAELDRSGRVERLDLAFESGVGACVHNSRAYRADVLRHNLGIDKLCQRGMS